MIHLLVLLLAILTGCSQPEKPQQQNEQEIFTSEYGFYFTYPTAWQQVTRDLPSQWALTQNENAIILTVNSAASANLSALGEAQALFDLSNESSKQDVLEHVLIEKFNETQWYTYALDYPSKNVQTIISGTLCNGKEVNLVLVSAKDSYQENRLIYTKMLDSFGCKITK